MVLMLGLISDSRAAARPRFIAALLIVILVAGVLSAASGVSDAHAPHVSLSASSTYEKVHPGKQVSFMVTITNEGETQENVTLQEDSPEEIQVSILDGRTSSVPGNSSQEAELLARVDSSTGEGARSIQVDAFVGNASAANQTLTVDVVDPPAQIALEPSPWERDAAWEEEADYFVTVHNHGEREDQVALRADGPDNVSITFPGGDARTVPAGESRNILLRAFVEAGAPLDKHTIEVRALARGETHATLNLGLNIIEGGDDPEDDQEETPEEATGSEPENETDAGANGSLLRLTVDENEATLAPGGKTTFQVRLENEAEIPVPVELRRNSDPHISLRMVGGVHREVPAGGSEQVDVEVSVDDEAELGPRTVIVYAIGDNGTLDHLRLTVNVDELEVEGAGPSDEVDTPGPSVALVVVGVLWSIRWASKCTGKD